MSLRGLRRGHQQRAERLEARFTPTWTGDPSLTVASQGPQIVDTPSALAPPVATDPAAKTSHGKNDPNLVPVVIPSPSPSLAPTLPDAVIPITTPLVTPLVPSTSVVVVAPSVVSMSSSSSVVSPPVISSSSISTTTVQTTPPIVATTPSSKAPVFTTPTTTFRSISQNTYLPSITSSASPSATSSGASSGMSTGSIVGIAAASIAGVAVIGIAGIWLLKRYFASRDEDDSQPAFQRHSWMRNSVAIPDDAVLAVPRGPSAAPRPPTMIERKQTRNFSNIGHGTYPQHQGGYPLNHSGYAQDNTAGMGSSDYQDSPYGVSPMPAFNPGGSSPSSGQLFFSPIASSPLHSPGVASFDESMPPMQHASLDPATGAPVYFSRRDSNTSRGQSDLSANLIDMPNPHDSASTAGYATLNRGSVTSYQAQQYAAISRQLSSPVHESTIEEAAPTPVPEQSPFEDPAPTVAPEGQHQEFKFPSPGHSRVDSSPMIPAMPPMSPVGPVATHSSIIQIASAFPAAPTSPQHVAFPAPVAIPGSPRSPSLKERPPLSPAPGAQGQVVSVPDSVHAGRETPVQFGFNDPAVSAAEAKVENQVSVAPTPKRMSIASKKSVAKSERPETMYDEEDAYGGF